ncbi:MAG TPA: RodZ domain-containing protein [Burkholderiales bacterium]|nr:RodZ domain-containing protein [Burkholderiales bacterium]
MSAVREEFSRSVSTGAETAGAILAAARQAQRLGVGEMSSHLRLSTWQVEALENDEYDRLPGPTFIRGIIRSYAKALQIDPQPALEAYGHASPDAEHIPINVPSQNIRFNPNSPGGLSIPGRAMVALLALVIFGGSAAWLWRGATEESAKEDSPTPQSAAAEVKPLKPDPKPALPDVQASTPPVPQMEAAVAPPAAPAPMVIPRDLVVAPAVVRTVEAPPVASQMVISPVIRHEAASADASLRLTFQDDSWVEIRDGKGKNIFRELRRAGAEETVVGRPPFSLIIGNARSVQLSYNDKPVDLTPHIRIRVARLTIGE